MRMVRDLLREGGRFRKAHLPEEARSSAPEVARADWLLGTLPRGVAKALGRARTSARCGQSTPLRAKGGVWHKKDKRERQGAVHLHRH